MGLHFANNAVAMLVLALPVAVAALSLSLAARRRRRTRRALAPRLLLLDLATTLVAYAAWLRRLRPPGGRRLHSRGPGSI